ncbi:putative polyketide synthase [Aspergillus sclerotioniger CBS 115572]|uniref:Putative polyketide synthase n=1 Tax=Aspergillus sclerotioniger CBS 115572 TaxID=1450535 RepID=A0A317WW49_9EURO|nr:putative polyketide synthase [Aspergillus sclerotioniger CBS 115572]PWY90616.1 putative polyketide synthase [Aspergillus sclerotioniger CBS 115572]
MASIHQETSGQNGQSSTSNGGPHPIAIVGFAFEFPQNATSDGCFWQMLCKGRSASTEFPKDRLNVDSFYHPDDSRHGTIPVRGGNFIHGDIRAFDAPFFSITPGEAACMDPQHRRMLETAYHALEDEAIFMEAYVPPAGIPISKCSGSDTSVYTGCFTNDYQSILQQDYEAEQRHAAMGIAPSMIANRVSWFFNFKGTSMNLDTACSSSLVALHLACQDLQSRTASMALAGGANLVFHPNFMKIMSSFNFLSPDSQCWSFDARASGYARGEGTVMVVLKRLDDALRDGNTIRAIIRNTGSNQDGRTPGITQPSLESQVELIERTYRQANIDMGPTRFFEAHGTGTPVGDPIEANAIGQAFQHCRTVDDPLYIGAVKANIGHLEGASGLAGLVKALLVLENGVIPPIAGLETLNRSIDPEKLRLHFPNKAIPWPTAGLRRACVNSFGFGGTNATVILDDVHHYLELNGLQGYHRTQQFPPGNLLTLRNGHTFQHTLSVFARQNGEIPDGPLSHGLATEAPKLLVWSAADKTTAQKLSAAYHDFLNEQSPDILALSYTLAVRRSHFTWKNFAVVDPQTSPSFIDLGPRDPIRAQDNSRLAFVFTGQGAQYMGMGRELFSFPVFRNTIDLLEDCLVKQLGCSWSLRRLLESNDTIVPVDEPEYSQPITTCLQIALVDLLESLGITPAVVLGHSSGEIAAAYASGGLSRFSTVKVAYYRGLLSSQLASRKANMSMMAVGISRENVAPYLDRISELDGSLDVSIGCVNSPQSITLTGNIQKLGVLKQWFDADSIFARNLRVPIAYHSHAMNEIADDYRLAIGTLEPGANPHSVLMMSSVTRDLVTGEALTDASYWVRNLTSTVEFDGALSRLLVQSSQRPRKQLGRSTPIDLRVSQLLEIGPHKALQGPINETLRSSAKADKPGYIPLLVRQQNAHRCLLTTVGKLYCAGYPVDILSVNGVEEIPQPMPPNMPRYPFNHQHTYWKEGRLSENFRFRDTARHELLGTRNIDWNAQVAQWRNIIRLNELPWLRDHKIDGQTIFPATGMVVMAVEALRQLLGPTTTMTGVQIRDVSFLHAIRFTHGAEQVETQLTLSSDSLPGTLSWTQFRLFVIENGSYVECCRGFIRSTADQESPPADNSFTAGRTFEDWISCVDNACKSPRDRYNMSTGDTVEYGPCFQNVENMRIGAGGEAVADVNMNTWKSNATSSEWSSKYTVHPCTMDGLAQLVVPALAEGRDYLPTMVPVRAASIWIDCSEPSFLHEGNILALARCSIRGNRLATSDIVGAVKDSLRPVLCIKGLETTFIGTASSLNESSPRPLCTRLLWRPDISMMSHEQIADQMTRDRPKEPPEAVSQYETLVLAISCFVEEAVQYLKETPSLTIPSYLRSYVDWMNYQQRLLHNGVSRAAVQYFLTNPNARESLNAEVEQAGVEGHFFMHVGRHLIAVLSGDADPLDVMFRNKLADRYYEQMLSSPHHAHPASVYIGHLCFKTPSMNILEVGAGTGGQTLRTLETLGSNGVTKCTRYDHTDISPGFFPRAQEKFSKYANIMQFRVCDISKDPVAQSFEAASYDLILASHVLHATRLDDSLRNIWKLLKPGGKLVLFETTNPDAVHIGFAFGLLKGWWDPLNHETRSMHSPCLTTMQWDGQLRRNGFSGVDIEVPGQDSMECRYSSIIISTAITEIGGTSSMSDNVLLVRDPDARHQCQVADTVQNRLAASVCSLAEISEIDVNPTTIVISLLELHANLLDGISETDYGLLQRLVAKAKNMFWISQPVSGEQTPQQHLAEGFGRTLASEDSTRKFVTLALECAQSNEQVSELIINLTKQIGLSSIDNLEANYSVTDGTVCIPRVVAYETMNERVSQLLKPRRQEYSPLRPNTRASLHLGPPGAIHTLMYREDTLDRFPLEKDELLVQVKAFGLTFRDYLMVSGQLDQLDLGTECAGIVQEAGNRTGFKPGDRVCLIGKQLARTYVRAKAANAAFIPMGMSFAEAASLPTSLWIAYQAVDQIARLEKGETASILQASSSIGQMMIQLAIKRGARVLAMASTASKREFVCNRLGIPASSVFSSCQSSLRSKLYQITGAQGVDVVIGSLADCNLDLSKCLAACGRIIDIGLKENASTTMMGPGGSVRNTTQASLSLVRTLQGKPSVACRAFHNAMGVYLEEHLKPPQPLNIYAAGEVGAAFESFQKLDIVEKRVIELTEGMTIEFQVDCMNEPLYTFPANASYVIAGGLGGLGRTFARWMANRGAGYLILLSRSGTKDNASRELLNDLQAQGVFVATPKVDISDIVSLRETLTKLERTMPPIRGCIQATVALRDNLFDKMSYEDWVVSTSSKVTGSWNLHQVLPRDLDFFVLLSSLNGIFGSRAQANYAAGNTFKDALALYRLACGQKAVSIDLGLMVAEGVVAENEFLLASMRRIGHLMEIAQEELLALLDHYCNPNLPLLSADDAQVLVGVEMPSAVMAKGLDLHHSIRRPIFSHLFRMGVYGVSNEPNNGATYVGIDRPAALKAASSQDDAVALVTEWTVTKVSQILGLSASDVESSKPIHAYGIDSLVAVDLKNWFERDIGANFTVFDLMGKASLGQLSLIATQTSRYRR